MRRISNSDVGPLGQRLADADQDAGGERHGRASGVFEHAQPHGRILVGRAEVRAVRIGEQPGRRRLEHHAHRRRHGLEPLEVLPAHHAGVEVRQQAGALEHHDRHRPDVGQRVVVAVLVEPFAGRRPAVLGPVAQGEQGLFAARGAPFFGDREDLVGRQVRPPAAGSAWWRRCSSGTGRGTAG